MKTYKKICMLAMMLVFAGGLFSANAAGEYAPVLVNDEEVIAAAEFAISAQQKELNGTQEAEHVKLTLIKILSAQKQVVAGMNFKIQLKVAVDGVEKKAEAVVWWQAWRKPNPYSLTSLTWK